MYNNGMNKFLRMLALTTLAVGFMFSGMRSGALPASAASDIALLVSWTSNTYTPLEYQDWARTLPIKGAALTFFATPFQTVARSGKNALSSLYEPQDPQLFYFVWYVNQSRYDQGQGVSSIQYQIDPYIRTDALDVRVQLFDAENGDLIVQQQTRIPVIQQPQILLYPIQNQIIVPIASQSFSGLRGSTIEILAKPYFFSVPEQKQIGFAWSRAGIPITSVRNDPYSLKITLPNTKAQTQFSVSLTNMLQKLQFTTARFTVQAQ